MASVKKIAELTGKAAGKAKTAATKAATSAGKAATGGAAKVKSMKKQDIATAVRGATSKVTKPKTKPLVGMTGDKTGKGLKVAAGATGAAAVGSVAYNSMKGGDREARETGTPNVEKKVASTPKSSASASSSASSKTMTPGSKGTLKPGRPATGQGKGKGSVYRAKAGDGLWQVAEKTVPKGQSVSAWWAKIKKLNSTNGKVNKTYRNSAIKLPPRAEPKDKGFELASKNKNSSKSTLNVD
jgi:hypothetical protein